MRRTIPLLLLACVALTARAQAPNDDCVTAIPIACGDTVQGSTTGAFLDGVATCGTAIQAPGIWYRFTGVQGMATLSTCNSANYDTRINVYKGSCNALVCVGGNDDGTGCAGYTSYLNVPTDAGTAYFVLVQGYNGQTGNFSLSLNCNSCLTPQDVTVSASDTQALVYWTTTNTSGTFTVEYDPPGFIPGTGTVVTGTIGLNGPPMTLSGLSPGTGLELYVQEQCSGGDVSQRVGPIAFTTSTNPAAPNAFCNQAAAINCGDTLSGDTGQGLLTPAPTCGPASVSARGLWYILIGSGEDVTLSTCNQASFDTRISVYQGLCGNLTCVAGNDDALGCGTRSRVTFFAENGEEYLVLLHGYAGAAGTFLLSMSCAPACANVPANDNCATAAPLPTLPLGACTTPVAGTNTCAYATPLPNPACDPWANIVDVWYVLNTGFADTHVLTLMRQSAGPLNMTVHTACGDPTYLTCTINPGAPVSLTGLPLHTDLYVRVWNGGGANAGTFTLCDQADIHVGVDGPLGASLGASPVPTADLLHLNGVPPGVRTAEVLDPQGRTVLRARPAVVGGNASLDVGGLSDGAYLLRLDDGLHGTVRFIVAH